MGRAFVDPRHEREPARRDPALAQAVGVKTGITGLGPHHRGRGATGGQTIMRSSMLQRPRATMTQSMTLATTALDMAAVKRSSGRETSKLRLPCASVYLRRTPAPVFGFYNPATTQGRSAFDRVTGSVFGRP